MAVTITPCVGCPVSELENQRFCGEAVIEDELCFVPGIAPANIRSVVILDPVLSNFRVELVCCNLIVVCGMLTKRITFADCRTFDQDIVFQANIPAEIDVAEELTTDEWTVTGVEVCSGCFTLLCATLDGRFHKLREKDIVLIQVDHAD
ncbi:hypothetical protein JK636_22180 [Clostridium sp. YIM B02515]|uniref:SipL SPOCS domain-containing protein n=1 Tax=Clostridium rhizosphaerae TaxID=2803861 RepID=A0ABS1TGB8_9CLOT|nr:hypothetical protein [Clostridium rhizosphaerae]MBL4938424.1 hypothetical protein [Clostridium rhizosphaerae]